MEQLYQLASFIPCRFLDNMAYGTPCVFLPGVPKMLGMGLENDLKILPSEEQLKKMSTFTLERKKADGKIKEPTIVHMTAKELSCEK